MMRSRPAFSFIVVAALVLGACSSGDSSNGDPTVPIPTAGTVSSTTSEPDSTSSTESSQVSTTSTGRPTSSAPTTTSTTGPPTTLIRPADLVTDPNDPNNLHASLPEHQPIIDAYLEAISALHLTWAEWPLDPSSDRLLAAPISAHWLETAVNAGMVERTQDNLVLDISGGITFRPYVVENDDPTRAFVWDCQIDATVWRDKDTGAPAPPDAFANVGPPGVESGVVAVMVLVDGRWLLDDGGSEPQACE